MNIEQLLPRLVGVRRNASGYAARCPAHEDHNPSLGVSTGTDGRILLRCHAGCPTEAVVGALGMRLSDLFAERPAPAPAPVSLPRPRPAPPDLPPMQAGTPEQWHALAGLRRVSPEAVSLAERRGLVRFGWWQGRPSWLVTDSARRNCQARRLDGQPWAEISAKAWTLPRCEAAWPVGIREAAPFPVLALVEGGPDLLAAFHFIAAEGREADCAAVAMLGASLGLHPDALAGFAGKRVRIFGHADAAGDRAVTRWAGQLRAVGATVDAFNFAGLRRTGEVPVNDLNDLTDLHPDDFEEHRMTWGILPGKEVAR